jgi:hypothetical protein
MFVAEHRYMLRFSRSPQFVWRNRSAVSLIFSSLIFGLALTVIARSESIDKPRN